MLAVPLNDTFSQINTIKTYSYGVQEFLNFYKKDLKELQLFEINEWRDELLGVPPTFRKFCTLSYIFI